jgi:hydrogenase-4 component B
MLALAGACVAIGLAPMAFWPAMARAASAWNPAWAGLGSPVSLAGLGDFHVTLLLAGALAGFLLWRRVRGNGLRRSLTWDCGYAAPTARMQYSSGSFAATITEWFGWILHTQRHECRPEGAFPVRASFEEHTPETVLEEVVEPAGAVVLKLATAARRLQHGRLQSYLLYLVVGLAALALLELLGARL